MTALPPNENSLTATLITEDGEVMPIVVYVNETGDAVAFPVIEDAPESDDAGPPAPSRPRKGLPPPIKRKRRPEQAHHRESKRRPVFRGVFRVEDQAPGRPSRS